MKKWYKTLLWRRVLPALLSLLLVCVNSQISIAARANDSSNDEREYLRKLSEADQFYEAGNIKSSLRIRSQIKPRFSSGNAVIKAPPITDPEAENLSPAAKVYWREAQQGIEQELYIKTFVPLQLMTDNYPDFLPAHLKLAEICEAQAKECADQARAKQPKSALDVLERVGNIYPQNTDILDKKLALLDRMAERNEVKNAWFVRLLDASIAARQFALSYPDHPKSAEYAQLADRYMGRYQTKLKQMISIYAGLGVLLGSSESANQLGSLVQGENAYGQNMLEKYRKKHTFITDPEITRYVSEIGNKLAKQIGRPDLNYQFYVDENQSENARTFPGGIVVIHSGLLQQARTEAELAGVISHEIAHSALSHYYMKQAELGLLQAFSRFIPLGDLFRDATDLDYKYRQEHEADVLGTRALAKAGYAADGLWSYLHTLNQSTGGKTGWASSHPAPAWRVQQLEALIATNGYDRYGRDGVSKQQTMQARIDSLLDGKAIPSSSSTEGTAFVSDDSAQSAANRKPAKPSKANPSKSPASPAKSTAKVTRGEVALNVNQERYGVTVNLDKAYISRSGTYKIDFSIVNGGDRTFGFVPLFAEVTDQSGQRVTARYDVTSKGGAMVDPGGTITGTIMLPNRKWVEDDQQGIIIVIPEGSSGGRVFRISL
jgi:hypothetical protein